MLKCPLRQDNELFHNMYKLYQFSNKHWHIIYFDLKLNKNVKLKDEWRSELWRSEAELVYKTHDSFDLLLHINTSTHLNLPFSPAMQPSSSQTEKWLRYVIQDAFEFKNCS